MADPDTYELVPVTPIRRLEKEIERLKKDRTDRPTGDLMNQVIDILKMNQKIVDDMTRMHGDLISQLYKTNDKLNKLGDSVAELVVVLTGAAEEEVKSGTRLPEAAEATGEVEMPEERPAPRGPPESEELDDKLERIIEQNTALINSLNVLGKELTKIEERGE